MRSRLVFLAIAATSSVAGAEIYQCTDARGQLRYTDFKPGAQACKLVSIHRSTAKASSTPIHPTAPPAADLAWLSAAREAPDPRERLRALEEWARGPRDWLDPVTHALVDPDATVRRRAQELLEQAWQR